MRCFTVTSTLKLAWMVLEVEVVVSADLALTTDLRGFLMFDSPPIFNPPNLLFIFADRDTSA